MASPLTSISRNIPQPTNANECINDSITTDNNDIIKKMAKDITFMKFQLTRLIEASKMVCKCRKEDDDGQDINNAIEDLIERFRITTLEQLT